MLKIEISCHDGVTYQAEVESFSPEEFANEMNSPQIQFVAIGRNVLNKNNIKSIVEIAIV